MDLIYEPNRIQPEDVVNRINYDSVESNLVYPLDKGFYYIAQVDEKWVRRELKMTFGKQITDIHNKYAIILKSKTGKPLLITNHDGKYWITERP